MQRIKNKDHAPGFQSILLLKKYTFISLYPTKKLMTFEIFTTCGLNVKHRLKINHYFEDAWVKKCPIY